MADNTQSNQPSTSRSSSNADAMTRSNTDMTGGEPSSPDASRANMRSLQSFRFQDSSLSRNVTSPEGPASGPMPRRNQVPRRQSARQLPRRGQGFSVDDASQEIEEQNNQTRRSNTLRQQQFSTVRHRSNAGITRLPFAHAEDDEHEYNPASQVNRRDFEPGRTLSRQNTAGSTRGVAPDAGDQGENDDDTSPDDDGEDNEDGAGDANDEDDEDADLSDAESFTLKDRQDAINETHPFGIRIWKPALYKKGRSVEKAAEGDIHSSPGGQVSRWLVLFNFVWTIVFGWWLALLAAAGALLCHIFAFAPGCKEYGRVLWGLAKYIFYPFGKYVKLIQEAAYAHEDEGEGRSISEYERWQQGDLEQGRLFFGPVRSLVGRRRSDEDSDDETASLLGRNSREDEQVASRRNGQKRRLFGRGKWDLGRVIFFVFFYGLLTPLMFLVSMICWLLVFTIPMGRVTLILIGHLQRRPLALEFHSDTTHSRGDGSGPSASIILCTYRAVGTRYWKYTIDGTNIFLINLLVVVAFTIFDYFVLYEILGLRIPLTDTILMFLLALFSIIPLAYFIGQAVASISAQSTMGVGAAINAFFSTVVEVFLYCVALNQGKARLVEGSIIGSIFAGVLFLPGLSMCFGAFKRKTQRFNVKSAGVTTTMLLFAVIACFSPTLFYQIYGSHEINCHRCRNSAGEPLDRDCRRCYFSQTPMLKDPFFTEAVRPYSWFAAVLLFFSYLIGLLFTLRTHAATIWNTELDEKKLEKMENMGQRVQQQQGGGSLHASIDYGTVGSSGTKPSSHQTVARTDIRDSQLYRRILTQSMKQAGLKSSGQAPSQEEAANTTTNQDGAMDGSIESLRDSDRRQKRNLSIQMPGMTDEQNQDFIRYVAEMAATAATVAARDATQNPRKASTLSKMQAKEINPDKGSQSGSQPKQSSTPQEGSSGAAPAVAPPGHEAGQAPEGASGGHDAPNWGRLKSYTVLLTATVAYAVIAEILVNTVDSVLSNVDIDEKFLGITLFALVPNTTEFLNAISFAMNGNIALSMEIGSAYALQVCLLQMPALVLFSAVRGQVLPSRHGAEHMFSLLFPQWDMITVILCVFLLSYMYGEGKSNYFKGSILILSYFVVVVGFYLSSMSEMDAGKGSKPSLHLFGNGFTDLQMMAIESSLSREL